MFTYMNGTPVDVYTDTSIPPTLRSGPVVPRPGLMRAVSLPEGITVFAVDENDARRILARR